MVRRVDKCNAGSRGVKEVRVTPRHSVGVGYIRGKCVEIIGGDSHARLKSPLLILEVLAIWQRALAVSNRRCVERNNSGKKCLSFRPRAAGLKFSTLSCFPPPLNDDDNSIRRSRAVLSRSRLRMAALEPAASFKPALLVVDLQEDFCPPVSGSTLSQPELWKYTYYCEGRLTSSSWSSLNSTTDQHSPLSTLLPQDCYQGLPSSGPHIF